MTSALKFRDMILSKFTPNINKEEMSEDGPNKSTSPDTNPSSVQAKSRLSFSVDSLLQKKIEEDVDDIIEDQQSEDLEDEDEDIEEEEAEDLTSKGDNNNIDITKNHSRIAMPTPLMPNSLASNLMRPQPHFLAAGIAAMAAAAMASNNAVTSNSTSSTSTPSISSNGPWNGAPHGGHPTPPLSFPFGLPGLRHPLFSSGTISISKGPLI